MSPQYRIVFRVDAKSFQVDYEQQRLKTGTSRSYKTNINYIDQHRTGAVGQEGLTH